MTVTPSVASHETFPIDPFPVYLIVSLLAIRVMQNVVNPFLQIVKDHQAIFFPDGLLDVLEARSTQNLSDLYVPDPDQV